MEYGTYFSPQGAILKIEQTRDYTSYMERVTTPTLYYRVYVYKWVDSEPFRLQIVYNIANVFLQMNQHVYI